MARWWVNDIILIFAFDTHNSTSDCIAEQAVFWLYIKSANKRKTIRPMRGFAYCKCAFMIIWMSASAGTHRCSLSLLNGWDRTRARGFWGSGTPGWNGWLIFAQSELITPMSPVFSFSWYVCKNKHKGTEMKERLIHLYPVLKTDEIH